MSAVTPLANSPGSNARNFIPYAQTSGARAQVSYKVPPPVDFMAALDEKARQERVILSWALERVREGQTALAAEPAYADIQKGREIVYGTGPQVVTPTLSQLDLKYVRNSGAEIVATYSNVKPVPDFQTQNRDFDAQANALNGMYIDFHHSKLFDRSLKRALQKSFVEGTGWLSLHWKAPAFGHSGDAGFDVKIYGAQQVLPVQIGDDGDPQSAYGMITVNETPIARAHALYPQFQNRMNPDRQAPSHIGRLKKKLKKAGSVVLSMFGRDGKLEDATTTSPTVDVFHVWIKDTSVNNTGQWLKVCDYGDDPAANWHYMVPPLTTNGMPTKIATGQKQWVNNEMVDVYRDVTHGECLLYPRGRLIICTRTVLLYDGPNPYWHGRVPLIPIRLDAWEGNLLGFSLAAQLANVEKAHNNIIRRVENMVRARLRPPFSYDERVVDAGLAAKIDPMQEGQRWKENRMLGEGVKFPFPWQFYDIPLYIGEFVTGLRSSIKEMLGIPDTRALQALRQMPSGETVEKMLESMGPIVLDRAREIEAAMTEFGTQFGGLVFQFCTAKQRLRILGLDGVTREDFDFDPDTLVPKDLPGATRAERAQRHMKQFSFKIAHGSMHEITSMTRRLLLLQLMRGGFPVDWWTMAEAFNIPNFGMKPEGQENNTVLGRWKYQQQLVMRMMVEQKALEEQLINPVPNAVAGALGAVQQALGAAGANGNGEGGREGRPPTAQEAPHMKVRPDQSSTISESG